MSPSHDSLLRSSTVYFFLALFIFLGSAGYGVFQYRIFEAEHQAILDNKKQIDELTEVLVRKEKEFRFFSEEREKQQAEFAKKITSILPQDEQYTNLTRQLDSYIAKNDKPSNPLFQGSLKFSKGAPVNGFPGISGLSVSMNLEGTRDQFFKFLDFINESGSLETGTRLMELNSIQLNFPEGGENLNDPTQKINFTVDMTAYYQTPKVAR